MLELRAGEERAAILAKYQLGRAGGAKIDPWEDPEVLQYKNIDRYGFICATGVEEEERRKVRTEMERIKKWLSMLHRWDDVAGEKLRQRVFKGIPDSLRAEAWARLLGLRATRRPGKYEELKELGLATSPEIRQIDLDVNRTYRNHIMFRERFGPKQQELFRVLATFSIHEPEVGYCQGMAGVVALLLMYLDEEAAFWALTVLVSHSKYNMHGFFVPGFPKLLKYQEHHDRIMDKFLPRLKKHLDRNGVDTGMYTLKWFFQCFLDRIPFRLTLRVWDIYLLLGERVLPAMAYNLLKLHTGKLIRMNMEQVLQFLVDLEKNFELEDDQAIQGLARCLDELRKHNLHYP